MDDPRMETINAYQTVYPSLLLGNLARSNDNGVGDFLTHPSGEARRRDFERHLDFAALHGGLTADRLSRLRSTDWNAFFQSRAELLTAYFLHHHARLPLEAFDPVTSHGTQGDSLHRLPDGQFIFVEVKAPVEEMTEEASSFDNSPLIRQQLDKAYDQLPKNMTTLVVLFCSGFDVSPARNDIAGGMDKALYGNPIMRVPIGVPNPPVEDSYIRNGLFQPGLHRRLSAVAVLEDVFCSGGALEYLFKVYHNPYATRQLSVSTFRGFRQFSFDREARQFIELAMGRP